MAVPHRAVTIVEVSPRDGLQNETARLTTEDKQELVTRALQAGLTSVEVTSFVSPRHVPAMADAEDLLAGLARLDLPAHEFSALVVNQRGVDRAAATIVTEINAVVVCSDTLGVRNQGMSTTDAIAAWLEISSLAKAAGLRASVTLAAAFGCPFEGEMPVGRVVAVAEQVLAGNPATLGIADTIGVAVPAHVRALVGELTPVAGAVPLRAHLHNTRNTGIANAISAVESGVALLDASLGGIGGCPFAPKATGNIATEDLVYALERSGYPTGVDLDAAISIGHWLGEKLGRPVPGMVTHAGGFPRDARPTCVG